MDTNWPALVRSACVKQGVPQHMFDDVVQECLISVWLYEREDPPYVYGVVRHRINDLLRDEKWTGRPDHRGKRDAFRFTVGLLDRDSPAPEVFPGVIYHQAEIRAAVRGLPHRERAAVYEHVWEQTPTKKMTVDHAYWARAKKKLKERLKHLEDL